MNEPSVSGLVRLIRGKPKEIGPRDASGSPQSDLNPGAKGKGRAKTVAQAAPIAALPLYIWPKKPHRKGTVECAACRFKERRTVLASVIEEVACSGCGEVRARLLPGSTPVEPPCQCQCGNFVFLLRSGRVVCRQCGERLVRK